jgi:hypothetical protein
MGKQELIKQLPKAVRGKVYSFNSSTFGLLVGVAPSHR